MSVSFVSFGVDVVGGPVLGTTPGAGNDAAGQITLTGGTQIFDDTHIVEFIVDDAAADGELLPSSNITGIRVYETLADYQAGTALYSYSGSSAVQDDLTGMGDTYLNFDASTLVTDDPGAPALTGVFVAPGTDATDNIGALTLDHDTDVDYSGDGTIQPGTTEEGNTYFNINYPTQVYGPIADGVVMGTDAGQVMGLGYVDAADGDEITTGDDQIDGFLGDDTIDGDAGNDGVSGGGGDDVVTGGAGNDWVLGDGGDDTITVADGWGQDVIIGGETHEIDGDTLDASAVTGGLTLDLSGADHDAGTLTDGTSGAEFSEIETVVLGSGEDTVVLGDGGGARSVGEFAGPTDNGDGTFTGTDMLDVSGLTNGSGVSVSTSDVTVSDDGDGNAVLTFPGGESLTLLGIAPADIGTSAALEAMGIPASGAPVVPTPPPPAPSGGSDYIVSGTDNDDWIDDFYSDDPQGDMVDAGDAADLSNDDHIQGGAGNDTILAGLGDDLSEGGEGNDQLEGGEGNDTLIGGVGDDYLYGNEGDDSGLGGAGNDTFEGHYGNDYFFGGAGDDRMLGDSGNDTLIGGDGNDWLRGSVGYDSLEGGLGDDYLWTGYQDDTIRLEDNFGNDTIEMEDIDETYGDILDASAVTSDLTVDMRAASAGVGTLSDGVSTASFEGVEHLILGSGTHTVVLGQTSGADAVEGFTGPTDNGDGTFTGHDQLDLTNMVNDDGDLIDTDDVTVTDDGSGNAVLTFSGGENITLVGVSPAELATPAQLTAIGIPLASSTGPDGIVEGAGSDDLIDAAYTGDPQGDMVDGADGNDDNIQAGAGNDTVLAGAGADTVWGGAGDDQLDGGDGADSVSGGSGNDSVTLGAGDTAFGNEGDDSFAATGTGGGHMSVDGGENDETIGDTLNITGPATITYDAGNSENGTVEWDDGTVLDFENIENVNYVPCFTPTTLIKTLRGELPAGLLQAGDRVLTRDNGFQEICWTGARALSVPELKQAPNLRPILIRKGALGDNQPERDMLVSPQHRMLFAARDTALWFGEPEVFAPAIALTCLDGVQQVNAPGVTYVHFMTERHQVVIGDNAWSESFQPGDMTLASMDQPQRDELFTLFPELAGGASTEAYPAARVTLDPHEIRVLAG